MNLLEIADQLNRQLGRLRFGPPVTHVYNPLEYARAAYAQYVGRFAGLNGSRPDLLLGMNPGPWGMAQTGVPFGEVGFVRDWLGIDAAIGRPTPEHPKRPVLGLSCTRSEVSGARLWGWARDEFGSPERFFKTFFVANYCPLAFMSASGANLTPDKLPASERAPLLCACDDALRRTVELMRPRRVVGIGAFAESRARSALDGVEVVVGRILHPSPASPLANRDWAGRATQELRAQGIRLSCED